MNLKTYRAASLHEALALVRRDLGPDASVLHTRCVAASMWGLLGQRQIEVTASNEVEAPSRLPPHLTANVADRSAISPVAKADRNRMFAQNNDIVADRSAISSGRIRDDVAKSDRNRDVRGANIDIVADRSAISSEPALPVTQVFDFREQFRRDARLSRSEQADSLVEQLARGEGQSTLRGTSALDELVLELAGLGVSPAIIAQWRGRLEQETSPGERGHTVLLRAKLASLLEAEFRVTGPLRTPARERRVVALVGPTGVGKTTTIAKLAAHYRLHEKRRVGLITVDTYRIAAVDQLRTYADIIDLPLEVVSTPRDMRAAVARLAELDLVLIDTAGRSPRDTVQLRELQALLAEAKAQEVHLVVSAVAGEAELLQTADQFAGVGCTAMLLTKIDEAARLGQLVALARHVRWPWSYVSTGQAVPHDLAPADGRRLAQLVLGLERKGFA